MCMKKVLISYGDHNYEESLERIKREATSLGIFDEIFLYTDKMLPANFSSYTKQYSRGGGYWLWKPWIIHHTLEKLDEGDIVVYVDAGCTLLKHKDWEYYFNQLKQKEAVFFIATGKNKKWCKQAVFNYFNPHNHLWKFANQIQATFLIIKKTTSNNVINHWNELARKRADLFIDVPKDEVKKEANAFKEHRHDQSVLTGCICFSKSLNNYCFLSEKMEKRYRNGQAVLASRISSDVARGVTIATTPLSRLRTFFNIVFIHPLRIAKTKILFRLSRF